MSYGNFKDPVGLLKRMLTSGNKAAYFTLLREGMSLLLKPVDWLWQFAEARKIAAARPANLPLIIILGGSRSGTTVLYQTLAEYLPVSYFHNLSASFPRSPISSTKVFHRFAKKGRSQTFNNYYGSVSGFYGPNDGFHIWNRWLGEDRNAIPADLSDSVVEEMQAFFHAWHEHLGRPFLNKNNRNSLCVDLFLRAFPQLHFVEIRRDPLYVVQSLIQSREAVQGDKTIGWGLATKDSSDGQSYIQDICQQVRAVEQTLDEARMRVPEEQYTFVRYEDFCADPAGLVAEIYEKVWQQPSSDLALEALRPLRNTNRQKLDDDEFQAIKAVLVPST